MKPEKLRWQAAVFYFAMAAAILWLALSYRVLFGPLIISALIAYLLYPVVNWISARTRINRKRVVILVFLVFLLLIAWAVAYLVPSMLDQANRLTEQLGDVPAQLEDLADTLGPMIGVEINTEEMIASLETNINQMFRPERIFRVLLDSTTNIVWAVVVIITIFHLLRDWELLREWLFSFVPPDQESDYRILHKEIKIIWRSYLRGQLLIMFLLGLFSGIGSAAIGLPNALLLGFLAGTLALIPSLGPATATAIAALVAWTQGSSYLQISNLWITILTVGIFQLAQLIEGFWLTPRIMGRRMKLHPGIVLIAVIGTLFTFGALLALIIVPTIGTLTLLVRFFHRKQSGQDPWPEMADTAEKESISGALSENTLSPD